MKNKDQSNAQVQKTLANDSDHYKQQQATELLETQAKIRKQVTGSRFGSVKFGSFSG